MLAATWDTDPWGLFPNADSGSVLARGSIPATCSAPLPQKLQTFLELGNGHQELVLAQDAFFL